MVDELTEEANRVAVHAMRDDWLVSTRARVGEVATSSLSDAAEQTILPRLSDLLESERFRHWVVEEVVPRLRPTLIRWMRDGHLTPILERFDVKGRVEVAANALEVQQLEDMANRVGAHHLGAIQVLGFVFGLLAGSLLALVSA